MLKCTKCGAELSDGVSFCRECGAKVEPQKKYCRECGNNVPLDARFCSHCGADLTVTPTASQAETDEEMVSHVTSSEEHQTHTLSVAPDSTSECSTAITARDKIVAKLKAFWNGLDCFSKAFTISLAMILQLLLVALASRNTTAIAFSIIQTAGLVVLLLWHRDILSTPKEWLKNATVASIVLFTVLNILSYAWSR